MFEYVKECDNRKYYIKVFVATLVLIVVFFVGFIIGSYLLYNDFKEEIDGKIGDINSILATLVTPSEEEV